MQPAKTGVMRASPPAIEVTAMADIVQVALRGSRKEFFLNSRTLWLQLRDDVIVQGEHGEGIGKVFLKDPTLVQLKRPGNVTKEIIRKATEEDLDQDDHNRAREMEAFSYARDRIETRELKMDLSEVEVAFSGHRIVFFFSAEHRVDFRELVKDLATRFRCRIELRQVGVRDQAKRLDGCGPCGRAFCCSTWLKDFHPVTLKMAREQQLSLNPSKISGACGRLMCCLSYELAQYRDSAERLPPVGAQLRTGQGICTVTRTEVHREAVWIRDSEGAEHRIAMDDLPPGPYHKCGDCNCGKRDRAETGNGHGDVATKPEDDPPAAWADAPSGPFQ
jgi:cell fate regulator YaaT (PSP1 superfamily)